MRKMMNKKGFSLTELLVVVVLLGIMAAISVPIYTSLQKSSEKKECESNIKILQLAVTEYWITHQEMPENISVTDLAPFIEDGVMPTCKKRDGTEYNYGVAAEMNFDGSWSPVVVCGCDDAEHTPEGESDSFPTKEIVGECQIIQTPGVIQKKS